MAAFIAFALGGCVTSSLSPSVSTSKALDEIASTMPSGGLIRDGISSLYEGDAAEAEHAFSLALRDDPENPNLHFLNGLAYHLGFVKGAHGNRELAETGYLVALRLDPNHGPATTMLGQLYLDTGRYELAQDILMRGYGMDHERVATLKGLAVASYYARDVPTALWAIRKVEGVENPWTAETARSTALIHAAAGDFTTADNRLAIYGHLENDAIRTRAVTRRVAQWRRTHDELTLAQSQDDVPESKASDPATDSPAGASDDLLARDGGSFGIGADSGGGGDNGDGTVSPNWRACDKAALDAEAAAAAAAASAETSGTAPALTADEASSLPALPSPCRKAGLPRMTVIDAVIIRSQDLSTTSKGVNLLDGLQVTLGGNLIDYSRVHTKDTSQYSKNNRSFTIAFPSSDSAVTYNLNIANATDTRNEVIARPSIVALDRQSSTFFSGTNLSTVSSGQYGGNAVDHQAGVSLSVTPTFIDDDSMLLAIKAARSFFDSDALTLSETVPSSRSVVQANVRIRYGQTLVLSGLNERESQGTDNGVPVLKDLPLVQYFFNKKTTSEFNKSVLILMTPRRVDATGTPRAESTSHKSSPELARIRQRAEAMMPNDGNLALIRANLQNSVFYRQFQSGDIKAQVWTRPGEMRSLLDDLLGLLIF
ncbi:MAG: hypothetical protein OQJ99_07270 [Rhodospirillales bacterium]|nr:hypothetical protein [Rhodospirillales bacterium]